MKPINWTVFFLLFYSFISFGCMGQTKPDLINLGNHDITTIMSDRPVSLINAQETKETELSYKDRSGGPPIKINTNLNDWNLQAIQLLKDWFNKNGIDVVDGAERQIQVFVSDAKVGATTGLKCSSLSVNLKTNDGFESCYPGRCCAGGGLGRSMGYAINYAVVNVMNDHTLLKHLAK